MVNTDSSNTQPHNTNTGSPQKGEQTKPANSAKAKKIETKAVDKPQPKEANETKQPPQTDIAGATPPSFVNTTTAGTATKHTTKSSSHQSESTMITETPPPLRTRIKEESETPLNRKKWDEMYERLVQYKQIYGHVLVPKRDRNDPKLGCWVATQR